MILDVTHMTSTYGIGRCETTLVIYNYFHVVGKNRLHDSLRRDKWWVYGNAGREDFLLSL